MYAIKVALFSQVGSIMPVFKLVKQCTSRHLHSIHYSFLLHFLCQCLLICSSFSLDLINMLRRHSPCCFLFALSLRRRQIFPAKKISHLQLLRSSDPSHTHSTLRKAICRCSGTFCNPHSWQCPSFPCSMPLEHNLTELSQQPPKSFLFTFPATSCVCFRISIEIRAWRCMNNNLTRAKWTGVTPTGETAHGHLNNWALSSTDDIARVTGVLHCGAKCCCRVQSFRVAARRRWLSTIEHYKAKHMNAWDIMYMPISSDHSPEKLSYQKYSKSNKKPPPTRWQTVVDWLP